MSATAQATLTALAAKLAEDPELRPHVITDPGATVTEVEPALAALIGAGPIASDHPEAYALVVEAVFEGYLLHRDRGRLIGPDDADLALLAGDYLYALGIERLARLGDLGAVGTLAALISACARARAERREELVAELWLGAACAVGWGRNEAFREQLERVLDGAEGSLEELVGEVERLAGEGAAASTLSSIRETVGFQPRSPE